MSKANPSRYFLNTEKKLLKSTSHLLRLSGPASLKNLRIATSAHVAESTFYHHYHDIDDLISTQTKLISGIFKSYKIPNLPRPRRSSSNPPNPSSPTKSTTSRHRPLSKSSFIPLFAILYRLRFSLDIILLVRPFSLLPSLRCFLAHFLPTPSEITTTNPTAQKPNRSKSAASKSHTHLLNFYAWQLLGLLFSWQHQKFSKKHLEKYSARLCYLLKSARQNFKSPTIFEIFRESS